MGGAPVLIVDDNPVNLKLVRAVLAADGYDIRTAADGAEAWTVLEQFRPRLILMDVQLPGADGFELTRRLKLDPATRDIVVLAITAYAMPGDKEKAYTAGCSGYLTKPVDTRTLPATVKLHMDARTVEQPAFEAGDYHDLLAELRANFLVDGEEEASALAWARWRKAWRSIGRSASPIAGPELPAFWASPKLPGKLAASKISWRSPADAPTRAQGGA